MPVSVCLGVPERIFVKGSNFNQDGRSLMGLTFAEIVTGWLSGSMKSVFESFAAKGIPYVANKVLIDSLMIGFELTKMPKGCVNVAYCLSVAVT